MKLISLLCLAFVLQGCKGDGGGENSTSTPSEQNMSQNTGSPKKKGSGPKPKNDDPLISLQGVSVGEETYGGSVHQLSLEEKKALKRIQGSPISTSFDSTYQPLTDEEKSLLKNILGKNLN
ncbi:hypothetical protein OAK75_08375 [Bacteriovoracales bacterium]|nr:hypothetical protein [Bacteriovoracales bacterium]